ncbi:MAG: hypothetical protein AABW90_02510 [Nanoarchaeota archaeon]
MVGKVLYICRANIGRSQIAEAYHNNYSHSSDAISAGTYVNEHDGEIIWENKNAKYVLEVMNEEGIDIINNKRKQLNPEMVNQSDKIVMIAKKEDCPIYLTKNPKVIYWDIEDAKGTDYNFHVKIRDQIKLKVKELLQK